MNWLDHALVDALGLSLLHFLWQGALIGLLYAASLPLMRASSAQSRYLVAVATLALLALAPPITLALLLGANPGAAAAPAAGAVDAGVLVGFGTGAVPATGDGAGFAHWVVMAWLAGVTVLSARLLIGWRFLRQLRRSADFDAARSLRPLLRALAGRLALGRPAAVAVSAGIRSPVVIGFLKPLVLLPPAVLFGLPTRQLEMVLAHELAHVRRLDHLVNLGQTVVETALFYHPVVRWVSRRIRTERENACDDLAVAVTGDRLSYVEMLASIEKLRYRGPKLALAVHDGQVLSRIRRLVERGRPGRQLGLAGPALLLALILATAGGLHFVEPEAEAPEPEAEPVAEASPSETGPEPEPEPKPEPDPEQQGSAPVAEAPEPAAIDRAERPSATEQAQPTRSLAAAVAPLPEPTAEQAETTDDTGTASAASEPPALPKMETDRLPPVSELIEPAAERELAMLAQPALTIPMLPEPPARKAAPAGQKPGLSGGKLIERIEPEYPSRAMRRGIDGSVEVEFLVTRSGEVRDVRVLDESPRGQSFAEAAREAVSDWRFEPFQQDGQPVEHRMRLGFAFDLGDEAGGECRRETGSRIPRCY
ncbi:M56 family metallopeptidase [Wenzhouxiangella sp. EGI_FJ10409]|uniref:M56 family metallopeptidase n=1 Tax=Wenzhouxiangella sp. EGI_FJ10409 TaxID=3243767 RepID=UPI0035E2E975